MKVPILLVDPPWEYYGSKTKDGAAAKHYDLMTLEQLIALPIRELLEDKGALLLWTTGPKMPEAVKLIRKWGLHYRNVAYVWIKTNKAGEIIAGQGPPATMVKQNAEYLIMASVEDDAEFLLLATSNKRGRPFKIHDFAQGQVVCARRREHSQKPGAFHKRIEAIAGDIPKLELFARQEREGWTCLGNEIDGKDITISIQEFLEK